MFRLGASYVDSILTEVPIRTLPIERPSKFAFAMNLRTAKALQIVQSQSLRVRADR